MIVDISYLHYRLPPDAKPVGRERHIFVEPDGDGAWCVQEADDGGASLLASGVSKVEAIRIALVDVMRLNATMSVDNGRRP